MAKFVQMYKYLFGMATVFQNWGTPWEVVEIKYSKAFPSEFTAMEETQKTSSYNTV